MSVINLNPEYLGPGAWWALHTSAANIRTIEDKKAVLYLIKLYQTKLFCKDPCQKHFIEFSIANPPNKAAISNHQDALFRWTWMAHNNANKLTGKNEMKYEEAYDLYYNNPQCEHSCHIQQTPEQKFTINKVVPGSDGTNFKFVPIGSGYSK